MGQSAEELRRDIERTREELGGTIDAIGDRVSPSRVVERRTNRMKDSFGSVRDRVMGSATDVRTSAGGRASEFGDRASGLGETVRDAPEAARAQTQGNPLMAGLVAFGLGAVVGGAFPGTRTESQLAQRALDTAEPLKAEAQRVGQELSSSMQESGQQAAEQIKETAAQGAEQVKGTAQHQSERTAEVGADAAERVKSDATTRAQQVKDETTGTADQLKG